VEPIVPEVPPTIQSWFLRGEYNDFELMRKAFYVEFHLNNQTISFFKLLLSFTNTNLERSKVGKSKKYAYRCTPVDEKTLWKYIGAYLIKQLQLNGEAGKVNWGGDDVHEVFGIGKCRLKVLLYSSSQVNVYSLSNSL
jgi:hypothetical protein